MTPFTFWKPIPDDTPDPFDIIDFCGIATGISNVVTITGINTILTIHLEKTALAGGLPTTKYRINGGAWVTFVDGNTLAINNNDTLQFQVTTPGGPGIVTFVLHKTNISGASLDSIIMDNSGC